MVVYEAAAPEGIVWSNVGRSENSGYWGRVLSVTCFAVICIFWTVPVSFILSISDVDSLRQKIRGLDDAIEKFPWLETLLQQLGPILLWCLDQLLYAIIDAIVKWEGYVGRSHMEASAFRKLSSFNVSRRWPSAWRTNVCAVPILLTCILRAFWSL